jgi:hypothetical protein
MKLVAWSILILAVVWNLGCSDSPTASAPVSNQTPVPSPSRPATDKWIGRWQGVEGTFLALSKNGDKYQIEIANLDGAKVYEGVAAGDHIEFMRNGKTETIRAVTGKETGMKWLADQNNCLVVTVGSEGFCRD